REWLDGNARLKLRVKAFAVGTLTLRLADEFNISSVTSTRLGRLMYLRVRNQDNFVVNLPFPVPRDTELELDIAYAGPVRTQAIDQESLSGQQDRGPIVQPRVDDLPFVPPERKWLFSNRSH